jgi:hypothetical protein
MRKKETPLSLLLKPARGNSEHFGIRVDVAQHHRSNS